MSLANTLPFDVLGVIFSYTRKYFIRGERLMEMKKLTKERYAPLRKLFRPNARMSVVKGRDLRFKMVDLKTKGGQHFTAHRVEPGNPNSEILYERL
jgi:hypothetical protein